VVARGANVGVVDHLYAAHPDAGTGEDPVDAPGKGGDVRRESVTRAGHGEGVAAPGGELAPAGLVG
jgi:hypothetical protein